MIYVLTIIDTHHFCRHFSGKLIGRGIGRCYTLMSQDKSSKPQELSWKQRHLNYLLAMDGDLIIDLILRDLFMYLLPTCNRKTKIYVTDKIEGCVLLERPKAK